MRVTTASGIVESTSAGSAMRRSARQNASKSPRTSDSKRKNREENSASDAIARADQSGIGSQPSVTEKSSIAIIPSQNTGTDEPTTPKICPTQSGGRRGNAAASEPTPTPRTTARSIATVASSIVAGNLARSSSPIETPGFNQSSPRSKRTAPPRKRP